MLIQKWPCSWPGDFNAGNLQLVLPHFYQHVTYATREKYQDQILLHRFWCLSDVELLVGCGIAHSRELSSEANLPDKLNAFYAHFEATNTEPCMRAPAVPDNCVIMLSIADVSKTFNMFNIQCRLPGRVLKACAGQRASVFPDIFNLSLIQSVIPTCFKQTSIVPVPKNDKVTCLNDYSLVALTSVAMTCFKRLVMAPITRAHSNSHTAPTDPQMTQSLLPFTLSFPTWTKITPTWECCSLTTAQRSTP